MFKEKDWRAAICGWAENKSTLVLFRDNNVTLDFDEYMELMHRDRRVVFLVDDGDALPDPEDPHTDEEFEALFDEVPEVALEEAKEHLTRAQKRHMIETLAAEHPELSWERLRSASE